MAGDDKSWPVAYSSMAIVDSAPATSLPLTPLFRLAASAITFALSFFVVCRELSVFASKDFELQEMLCFDFSGKVLD